MKVLDFNNNWNQYSYAKLIEIQYGVLTLLDENKQIVAIYNVNEWKRVNRL